MSNPSIPDLAARYVAARDQTAVVGDQLKAHGFDQWHQLEMSGGSIGNAVHSALEQAVDQHHRLQQLGRAILEALPKK